MSSKVEKMIAALGLVPHPEGGFFRETFRAPQMLTGLPRGAVRNASSAIYFLLPAGTFSAFHRVLGGDEVWHHYGGDPVELHVIDDGAKHAAILLGGNIEEGERPQVVIPAGALQGARVRGSDFALCGCTVAPGFDFADFVMPTRAELIGIHPEHREIITRLTRG